MTRIHVGIGGWNFAPWRGTFYPAGLPQAQELAYASRHVTSIEINATFYGSQKPESFRKWREQTPDGFVFAIKGPRFTTHRRDLAESGQSIGRFLETGVTRARQRSSGPSSGSSRRRASSTRPPCSHSSTPCHASTVASAFGT